MTQEGFSVRLTQALCDAIPSVTIIPMDQFPLFIRNGRDITVKERTFPAESGQIDSIKGEMYRQYCLVKHSLANNGTPLCSALISLRYAGPDVILGLLCDGVESPRNYNFDQA